MGKDAEPLLSASQFLDELNEWEGYPVTLHIYDLTGANKCLSCFGIGAYHTGVEVHDKEFQYGFHDVENITGIYVTSPQQGCDFATYSYSIDVGYTKLTRAQVYQLIYGQLAPRYSGPDYSILYKNCNHFTAEFLDILCGTKHMGWLNRLARIGQSVQCLVPNSWLHMKMAAKSGSDTESATSSSAPSASASAPTTPDLPIAEATSDTQPQSLADNDQSSLLALRHD